MTTHSKAEQLRALLRQIFSAETDNLFSSNLNYPDGDFANFAELRITYERLRGLYSSLTNSNLLDRLPFLVVNTLFGVAQNLLNTLHGLLGNRADANQFKSVASQLENFAVHTAQYGMEYFGIGGEALEGTRAALAHEQSTLRSGLSELDGKRQEVEQLVREVRNLITPAIAGSLSKSFTERRDALSRSRWMWLGISGVIAVGVVIGLGYLGSTVATSIDAAKTGWSALLPGLLLRSIFLVPLFALLAFALSQYRKERNFEEEYAHKAAVAVSLPNYGDLIPAGPVRDQIVTGAANVIFSSPIGRTAERDSSTAEVIKATKEMIDSSAKLMPWNK